MRKNVRIIKFLRTNQTIFEKKPKKIIVVYLKCILERTKCAISEYKEKDI